jgi:hypothetical protein
MITIANISNAITTKTKINEMSFFDLPPNNSEFQKFLSDCCREFGDLSGVGSIRPILTPAKSRGYGE